MAIPILQCMALSTATLLEASTSLDDVHAEHCIQKGWMEYTTPMLFSTGTGSFGPAAGGESVAVGTLP